MKRRTLGRIAILLVAAMSVAAIVAGLRLPADMRLPIHWDLRGEPDSFAGKWVALFMPAAVTAAISLLFWLLPAIEPRAKNLSRSEGLYVMGWATMLLIGAAIEIVVLSAAFGWGVPANRLIVGAVGAMFMLIGNQLAKSRSMHLLGFRTPWTLASEEVWVRTHRLAGKLAVLGGLVIVVAALLPLAPAGLGVIVFVTLAAIALISIAYSFLVWRREPKGSAEPPE